MVPEPHPLAPVAAPAADPARIAWALQERVKELTCLYGIAQVQSRADRTLDEELAAIVLLLPPAWQYPAATSARITLDGRAFDSPGFRGGAACQAAAIAVAGHERGRVEVFYDGEHAPMDEGPFLHEERSLIDEIARQVGLGVERREGEVERSALAERLRHADRMSTIGQLAAGVAHELNEPLGAILGYSELIRDSFGLPDQTARDLERIIRASLRGREIVRQLLVFARQHAAERKPLRIEPVLREALSLVGARIRRSHVQVHTEIAADLPMVTGDSGQLQQVFVNLCVNAAQAMPAGGQLALRATRAGDGVAVVVEDTGTGMDEDTLRRAFDPFFTTKDVGQGTGLGLSVVHGIVTAHGGTIRASSRPGHGTRFELQLPGVPS